MVNHNQVVPIQKIDRISAFGEVLTVAGVNYTVLASPDVAGNFVVESEGTKLANQPAKTIDFAEGVSSGDVYFVAGTSFRGVKIAGADVTPSGDIIADGVTMHKATLADGAVTVVAVTPGV